MRHSYLVSLCRLTTYCFGFVSLWFGAAVSVNAATLPTLPKSFNTAYQAPSGRMISVNAGGDLQAAINNAQLGDTIVLQAGATFVGPFVLPNKTGSGWIYVQSSAYSSLPAPGVRVGAADGANMPKIVGTASSASAISAPSQAHHFRFVGIEFTAAPGKLITSLIGIGGSDTSAATLPHDIVIDRCYLHPDPTVGGRRAISMDGAYVAVIDSYLSGWKDKTGSDTQAIWAYNTTGPLQIHNNYLEAGSENINTGGADNFDPSLVPADIEITNNTFFKPVAWIGQGYNEKNLLEFKMAKRVLVSGNTFTNVWAESQAGWALIVSPRNQSGGNTWAGDSDITIKNNVFTNAGLGIRVGGHDDSYPSQQTQRVLIQDNVIVITGLNTNGYGWAFGVLGDPQDVTIDHNTVLIMGTYSVSSAYLIADYGTIPPPSSGKYGPAANFTFTNNIAQKGIYGIKGAGTGDGLSTLNVFFQNTVFSNNAIIGGDPTVYSGKNFFPATASTVQFLNYAAGDYRLAASSPYRNAATDGLDVGANVNVIAAPPVNSPTSGVPQPPSSLTVN